MIFDAHFHIIDFRFPLIPNKGYLPEEFTIENYKEKTNAFDIKGGAVVSGSFQGTDQTYLIEALKNLGSQFVGVTQLKASVTDEVIVELDKKAIKAIRFNLYRGGSENIMHLENFGKRVSDLVGWHVELYIDSREIVDYKKILLSLPKFSIDHLGLSKEGLSMLYELVEKGAKVKATGCMRVDFDIKPVLKQIYKINPQALMFGTDLPGTRASHQFSFEDLQLIYDNFDKAAAERILWQNAVAFYGLGSNQVL